MKRIPEDIVDAFASQLWGASVGANEHRDYFKWLRFYLDFCERHRHPHDDPVSLEPFLAKLEEKHQSAVRRAQALASISLYYDLLSGGAGDFAAAAGIEPPPDFDSDSDLESGPESGFMAGSRSGAEAKLVSDSDSNAKNVSEAEEKSWDLAFAQIADEIRIRQYSPKTLKTYRAWLRQFRTFLRDKDLSSVSSDDARAFLSYLATERQVAASTQNQAFNALLFFYRHVLKLDYDLKDKVVRARTKRSIPVVLSRGEVDEVLAQLKGQHNLAIKLLYGCGLRLSECLNLRVHSFNFDQAILTVHDGKGKKDRTVPLPRSLFEELKNQLSVVKALHEKDLAADYDGVFMPGALTRKWKNAAREFVWQWFFPAKILTLVVQDNERRRYHMHETELQKALRKACRKTSLTKRVTCHTFRHTFASHLLRANYDLRTIQQLLGHSDIRTTMIYTHTVKSRSLTESLSPLDFSPEQIEFMEGT